MSAEAARADKVGLRPYLYLTGKALRSQPRARSLSSAIVITMIVLVVGTLWREAIGPIGAVQGYTAAMCVWYLAVAECAVVSVNPRMLQEHGERIRNGDVLATLSRPVHLVWSIVAQEVGAAFELVRWMIPCTAIAAYIVIGAPPAPWSLLTLVVTLPLALLLNVLLTVAGTGACFWFGGERALSFVYQKFFFFGGGMLIPLEFLPGIFGKVLIGLPWAGTAYIPATLAVHDHPLERWWLIGLQLAWICASFVACAVIFRLGERKLVTEGG